MARVRQVTRTLVSTECEVMTVNTTTQKVASVVLMVTGTYDKDNEKDKKALDKAVRKSFENKKLGDDVVMVSVTSTTPVTMRYKMLEDEFIALAESTIIAIGDEAVEGTVDDTDDDTQEDEEEEEE